MRRIASLRLMLTLSTLALGGCGGYNTWSGLPFTTGNNPNQPVTDSENMRRVMGQQVEVSSLGPEPGDIWPGPLQPSPTLQDLEQGGLTGQPEQPVPGSPQSRNPQSANPSASRQVSPQPARGSSTSPGSNQPPLSLTPAPTVGTPSALVQPAQPSPAGQSYQTPRGSEVTTGGGTNYQTTVSPGGGSSIVVPNGNGTSTIIHSDGRIETVTTPK
jgi:hypothetical protein